ncbi:MAG: 3-hydroxyacyl-CoA dehydrogenase/enoyl-CoA hydratase family protein [Saprospirales bacterium]|nr:3-hydroxyacyl-CoA dehydrogenase/enoyl-CoA hydratase family protein [Saprospirales bacterium]
MAFSYKTRSLSKVVVIGAGQIGPDICLHFSKVFWNQGVQLVLIDISEDALSNAQARMEKKIDKGQETGAFRPEMAQRMKSAITYTSDYEKARNADLVVEAATENGQVKDLIFRQLEKLTGDDCIFLSNSSHMQPEVIFENIENKARCLVAHYFFPAERNPVIEIVPGAQTAPDITALVLGFYETIGKIPIEVKSSYGYAIDPIFEGLCQVSILCLEKGYGTVKQIDKIAQESLKQGVGSFTALNLTGGNPITNHGLEEMRKTHIPWFRSPQTLQDITRSGEKWDTAKRGEVVEISPETAEALRKQLLGGYFALASYIIDLGITNVDDLNMATEIGLVIAPPFSLMNQTGIAESVKLVEAFCAEHPDFPFPESLKKANAAGGWTISRIKRSTIDEVAVLTIRRPQALNALNLRVLNELKAELEKAEADASIKGVVITGFE